MDIVGVLWYVPKKQSLSFIYHKVCKTQANHAREVALKTAWKLHWSFET